MTSGGHFPKMSWSLKVATFECSWEEFKQRANEFRLAAPTLNYDELDNAFKALSLSYFGMREERWQNSATIVLKMATKIHIEREVELEKSS